MKQCPVLGCLRERRGVFCPTHWHLLSPWCKHMIRNGLNRDGLKTAIAEAIHQEQALKDAVWVPIDVPTFTATQEMTI